MISRSRRRTELKPSITLSNSVRPSRDSSSRWSPWLEASSNSASRRCSSGRNTIRRPKVSSRTSATSMTATSMIPWIIAARRVFCMVSRVKWTTAVPMGWLRRTGSMSSGG
ncbi:hypothetical protein D3C85_1152080 [compost metagenome]